MTQRQILSYAYNGALEVWSREYDRLQERPDSELLKIRYERANRDLDEIRALLLAEELKDQ